MFPIVGFRGVGGGREVGGVSGKLLSQWEKFGYIVVFPTTRNRLNLFQKMFVGLI